MAAPQAAPQWVAGPLVGTVCGVLLLLVVSCDPSVSVFDPSKQYRYSLFGTLDVAADTQVVRVDPLGDTSRVGTDPDIGATVLLENLDTGTQVALHDSFGTVGNVAPVHNFWTTQPIRPNTRYRVSVQRGGTTVTSAPTTTPSRPPSADYEEGVLLPCVLTENYEPIPRFNTFNLLVHDTEELAAVHVLYPVLRQGAFGADSLYMAFEHLDGPQPDSRVPIFYAPDLIALSIGRGCLPRRKLFRDSVQVAVVDGGHDWPHWLGLPFDEVARPDSFSNVEGGHGFVGGIYSDTIRVPIREREVFPDL